MAAKSKPDPKTVAKWLALGLGLYVILPWLRKARPAADVPGAEDTGCTGPFTLTVLQTRSIADQIHAAVYGLGEDEQTVADLLKIAQTDGDVCRIITAYGSRRLQFLLGPYNLPEIVGLYLTQRVQFWNAETYVDQVNADYRAKGISFQF